MDDAKFLCCYRLMFRERSTFINLPKRLGGPYVLYSSIQTSDPYFFAKVLFAIDNALQIHWRSCSSAVDRSSVNDRILLMSGSQDSILRHSFTQHIPKSISDKINFLLDNNKDGKHNGSGKFNERQNQGFENNRSKPDLVSDNDKNHSKWRIKEGEDFAKTFYKNQRRCPKTSNGKSICMKFFI
jgi:hypothetical protein